MRLRVHLRMRVRVLLCVAFPRLATDRMSTSQPCVSAVAYTAVALSSRCLSVPHIALHPIKMFPHCVGMQRPEFCSAAPGLRAPAP